MSSLANQRVVVFTESGDDGAHGIYLYLGSDPADSILPASPALTGAIKREMENQDQIAKAFPTLHIAQPDRWHSAVKQEVERLRDENAQEDALRRLRQIGPTGIPSLIRLMDD